MTGRNEFELLGAVLGYPEEGFVRSVERCAEALAASDPEAARLLGRFLGFARERCVEYLQALFTETFDLDPVCSLEVGWHLYGDRYARGEFLVKMRGELRRLGVVESTELPDHITHALAALARMEPEEGAEFVRACLGPALDRMRAGLEGRSNPFENVLGAVASVLDRRYPRRDSEAGAAAPACRISTAGGVVGQCAAGTGSSCEPDEARGSPEARGVRGCTLSVAGDRERSMAKQIGPVPAGGR